MTNQYTLAMIKPSAITDGHADTIKKRMIEEGFQIVQERKETMLPEKARAFYAEHNQREDFEHNLITSMTEGPTIILILKRENAIQHWRDLMKTTSPQTGKSWRDLYGRDPVRNGLHGSDSPESAHREVLFHFPNFQFNNEIAAPPADCL